MLRDNVYLLGEINEMLNFLAISSTAKSLLSLAEQAEKIKTKGTIPSDLIENLDYYTWGGVKKNDE